MAYPIFLRHDFRPSFYRARSDGHFEARMDVQAFLCFGMFCGCSCFSRGFDLCQDSSKLCRLTPRWSQRRLLFEFMDGLSYTTIIEFAEPFARRRGSALDR